MPTDIQPGSPTESSPSQSPIRAILQLCDMQCKGKSWCTHNIGLNNAHRYSTKGAPDIFCEKGVHADSRKKKRLTRMVMVLGRKGVRERTRRRKKWMRGKGEGAWRGATWWEFGVKKHSYLSGTWIWSQTGITYTHGWTHRRDAIHVNMQNSQVAGEKVNQCHWACCI